MYEIRHAGAKGLGVFATSNILRGTRVFSERPLLAIRQDQNASDVYATSKLLSLKDQKQLLQLSVALTRQLSVIRWIHTLWYTLKQTALDINSSIRGNGSFSVPTGRSIREHNTILNVFRNNAFELGSAGSIQLAVFRSISRINHSCLPNAEGNFNIAIGCFTIHALRDITPDEEIVINYLDSQSAIRETRQEKLLSGYGFACGCPACNLDLTRAVTGEDKRVKIREAFACYAETASAEGQTSEKELHTMQKLISLFEEEGIYGSELGVM